MRDCASIKKKLNQEEQDQTLTIGCLDSSHGIVNTGKKKSSGDNLVGNFNDNIGNDEGFPGICLARPLADLVEVTLGDKQGLYLSNLVRGGKMGFSNRAALVLD